MLFFLVAKSIKSNVKEILLKQATCEELPKLSIKEVTFAIEPIDAEKSQNACISQLKNDHLVTAKRVKRPVVLWNKDSESVNIIQNNKPNNPKILKIEPRKVLPDVVLYRWHSGFRHHQGRYTKVTVLKLELYYPDDLHDILISRNLNFTMKSLTLTLHSQSKVLDHKCLAEFVIFENLSTTQNLCNFNLKMSALFEAADLEEFDIDLKPFQPNVWLKHEFDKPKTTILNK